MCKKVLPYLLYLKVRYLPGAIGLISSIPSLTELPTRNCTGTGADYGVKRFMAMRFNYGARVSSLPLTYLKTI